MADDRREGSKTLPRLTRPRVLCLAGLGSLIVLASVPEHAPRLIWNASTSSPRGLYAVVPGRPNRGDFVVARPPAEIARLAAARGYLPERVPLVKTMAAGFGDRVCARHGLLTVNGDASAVRWTFDTRGRTLPRWHGCRTLRKGQILLLGRAGPASFDGRYFGPLGPQGIVGRAKLLWRD